MPYVTRISDLKPGMTGRVKFALPYGIIPVGLRYFEDVFFLQLIGKTKNQMLADYRKLVNREKKMEKKEREENANCP